MNGSLTLVPATTQQNKEAYHIELDADVRYHLIGRRRAGRGHRLVTEPWAAEPWAAELFIFSSVAQQREITGHREDEGNEFKLARNHAVEADTSEAPTEPELLSEGVTELTRVLATQGSPSEDDEEMDPTPSPTGVHRDSCV